MSALTNPDRPEQSGDLREVLRRLRRTETMLYRLCEHLQLPNHPSATKGENIDRHLLQ